MAIKQAPENKAVFAAPQSVGRLAQGHGTACCPSCGVTVATCGHLGHLGMTAAPIPCERCSASGG